MDRTRQNFHCNFRAPDEEWFKIWLEFKEKTKTSGLDICFVALNLFRAWLESLKGVSSNCLLKTTDQVVFVTQTNTFNYNIQKPRRNRLNSDCSKNRSKCTLCSRAFQAYIIVVARELNIEFCFRDFPEINHGSFRKLILKLKEEGKVLAMKPRSLPEFYILPEWVDRYPSMSGNNRVKPKLTNEIQPFKNETVV